VDGPPEDGLGVQAKLLELLDITLQKGYVQVDIKDAGRRGGTPIVRIGV